MNECLGPTQLRGGCINSQKLVPLRIGAGADLGLWAGGPQSVVPWGEGRHMCRSTYRRINISRLVILKSLHWH